MRPRSTTAGSSSAGRRRGSGSRRSTTSSATLDPDTLVIADPAGPIGIAGVMGGASSEVGDATTDVIVESAIFDPVNIRRTAFRYALRSEASLRFEKGQEFRLARIGADRTARLIAEWAGGEVAPGAVDSDPGRAAAGARRVPAGPRQPAARHRARSRRPARPPGARRDRDRAGCRGRRAIRVAAGAKPLEVDAGDAEVVEATVPTWRRDLAVEADIAEEVIRVHGYELVPSILPHTPMPAYRHDPLEVRDAVRETLVGAGLTEAVTFALVAPRMVERFPGRDDGAPADEPEQRAAGRPITVTNPLSSQHSVLRQSLLGSLLEVVATNLRHGRDDVAIFEVGKGYGARTSGRPTSGGGSGSR